MFRKGKNICKLITNNYNKKHKTMNTLAQNLPVNIGSFIPVNFSFYFRKKITHKSREYSQLLGKR